jgi:hypothetical protein
MVMTPDREYERPLDQIPLSTEETRRFQDGVLWGAINYLWGGNFLAEAESGEDIYFKRKIIGSDGPCRLILEAWAWQDYEGLGTPENPQLTHSMRVTTEQMHAELTEGMFRALSDLEVVNSDDGSGDYEDDMIQAWQSTSYYLDYPSIAGLSVEHGYELQDPNGEVFDDDRRLSADTDGDAALTSDERREISRIDEVIEACFTHADMAKIKDMLEAVRIPVALRSQGRES